MYSLHRGRDRNSLHPSRDVCSLHLSRDVCSRHSSRDIVNEVKDKFRFNIFLADVREEIGLTVLTESSAIVLLRIASPKISAGIYMTF